MIVDKNFTQINDLAKMVRREMERESEQLTNRLDQLTGLGEFINEAEAVFKKYQKQQEDIAILQAEFGAEMARSSEYQEQLIEENKKMQQENELLQQQLSEEKKKRAELEMKMAEMSKLSAGVAKKAPYEDLVKAIRAYTNKSKQKTLSKRTAIKIMILELASTVSLTFPEDLVATIESLDDEHSEPRVVQVSGNYNDIHDNGEVKGIRS